MADEISVRLNLRVSNGNLVESIDTGTKTFTQNAIGGPTPGYVSVGTSEETISLSELSTIGACYIQNLDATNYVEFGVSTGVYMVRLKAGDIAYLRLKPGVTLYAKANTATCKVVVKAFED
jgi:hypothetical protein